MWRMNNFVKETKMKSNSKIKYFILLHIFIIICSSTGIVSKLASQQKFLSFEFIALYALMIFLLGVYAIGWQQVIKHLPLTTAYTNKAVNILWGIIFGAIFFDETITLKQIIGAVIIVVGVVLFVRADKEVQND